MVVIGRVVVVGVGRVVVVVGAGRVVVVGVPVKVGLPFCDHWLVTSNREANSARVIPLGNIRPITRAIWPGVMLPSGSYVPSVFR